MKLKVVTGIVLIMLFLVVVSPIDVSVGVRDFGGESGDFVAQSSVDWWPMFRHDLNNTGYSTSKAPNTNNTIWTYTTGNAVESSPAVADGKVYVGSGDNNVYCLNALTGAHIWNYTTGLSVYSSPAVADGKVYVGSINKKVYAFGSPPPPAVGGVWVPVDKLGLLAPYIALASTILVATAATAIYVKHVKRRKEKQ